MTYSPFERFIKSCLNNEERLVLGFKLIGNQFRSNKGMSRNFFHDRVGLTVNNFHSFQVAFSFNHAKNRCFLRVFLPCVPFILLRVCLFCFLPLIYVSSTSTIFFNCLSKDPVLLACLNLCSMNHAVFCVTPISLLNWIEEIPFLCEVTKYIARNYFCSGNALS